MDFKYEMVDYQSQLFKLFTTNNISPQTRLRPIQTVSAHWHRSVEIIYIKKGAIDITIHGKVYELHDNDWYLINSKEIHALTFKAHPNAEIAIWQVPLETFQLFIEKGTPIFKKTADEKINNTVLTILENIYLIEEARAPYYQVELYGYSFKLLHHLLTHFLVELQQQNEQGGQHERVNAIINFIQDNACFELSATDVANQFEISHEYLSRLLKKYTQLNYRDLVKKVRLQKALDLLFNSNYTITEIAFECGFPSVNSFIRSFKQVYNNTPAKYRQNKK